MASVDDEMRADLAIDGMTCAACANRIQRGLSKLDGVSEAQVNFATGRATVVHDDLVSEATFRSTIEGLGYGIIDSDDSWRDFAAFGPAWAGGVAGRALVQGSYLYMQLMDRLNEYRAAG